MAKSISIFILILVNSGIVLSLSDHSTTIDDPTVCDIQITVPADITICGDDDIFLNGFINGIYDDFVWCENGSETSYDLDEIVEVDEATTFTLKASYVSFESIIINGDFESGDSGFTTDYYPGDGNCNHALGYLACEGAYNVISDPSDGHKNFDPCSDNGGGGNMMVVNGAGSLQEVWCQEVCVDPDGSYIFNAYGTSVNPSSPAILQFSIDGSLIGNEFGLSSTTCGWEFFEAEWQADGETSVEICVTNQNTASGGNDFALDDIGFFRVCKEEMSFDVSISDFDIGFEPFEEIDCNEPETVVMLDLDPDEVYTILWGTNDGNIVDVLNDGYTMVADQAGDYFVTVIDAGGCGKEEEIEIFSDIEPINPFVVLEDTLTCDNLFTEVYVDSDNNDLSFTWYDEDDEIISTEETIELSVAGSYYVVAVDEDTGCEESATFEIIEDIAPPNFIISKSSDLDCKTTTAAVSIDTVSNSVEWEVPPNYPTTIPSTSDIPALVPGIYIATLKADNGCTHTDSIEVLEVLPILDYTIQADSIISCSKPQADINIQYDTTNLTINWLTLEVPYNDSITFTLLEAGVYNFTLQDSIGCELADSIMIISDMDLPIPVIAQATEITCNESISTITANNPNNYDITWIQQNGLMGTGNTYQVSETGDVSYTYTAANGCTRTDSITVEAADEIPIISITGDTLTCDKTSVELSVTSDKPIVNYTWSNTTQANLSDQNNLLVTEAGTYNLEVISDLGCVVTADFLVLTDTIAPIITLPADDTLNCLTSIISGDVILDNDYRSIEYTGNWYDESSQNTTIVDAGTYTLSVTGNNGCVSEDSIVIAIDTIPILIDIISDTILNCNIDTITASFTANETYTDFRWDGYSTTSSEATLDISFPGIYTLSVVGNNGCITSDVIAVTRDILPPTFMASASEINCAFPQSTINLNVTGPVESIFYFDENGAELGSGNNFMTDYTDAITIEVIGINGCTSIAEITAQVDLDNFDFEAISDTITCSTTEVFIDIADSLSYTESNIYNSNGNLIGDLTSPITEAGLYTIELTLDNGCTSTSDVIIVDNFSTSDFSVIDIELNCNVLSAPIVIDFQSAYDRVEILDPSGVIIGDENMELSEPGLYSATVYNINGCPDSKIFNVTQLVDAPQLNDFTAETYDCAESVALQINNIIGGVAPYTITIDNTIITEIGDVNLLSGPGQYDINIEDSNGCSLDTLIIIPELVPLTIEPIADITITAGASAQLMLNVNRDINEIQEIQWREGQFLSCYDCIAPIFSGDNTTTYQVNVTDIYGCTTETEVRVIIELEIDY